MNNFVSSCYSNGKYYLACTLNFNDNQKIGCENQEYYNNVLLELDLETNNLNIMRGVDIRNLNSIADDKVNIIIACYKENGTFYFGEIGKFGGVYNNVLPKCWKSPLGDLGYPEKLKIVKDVYIKSDVPLTVTIRTEKLTKQFNVVPKNNLIHLSTLIKWNLIAIDFETTEKQCEISNPSVIVGLV